MKLIKIWSFFNLNGRIEIEKWDFRYPYKKKIYLSVDLRNTKIFLSKECNKWY